MFNETPQNQPDKPKTIVPSEEERQVLKNKIIARFLDYIADWHITCPIATYMKDNGYGHLIKSRPFMQSLRETLRETSEKKYFELKAREVSGELTKL